MWRHNKFGRARLSGAFLYMFKLKQFVIDFCHQKVILQNSTITRKLYSIWPTKEKGSASYQLHSKWSVLSATVNTCTCFKTNVINSCIVTSPDSLREFLNMSKHQVLQGARWWSNWLLFTLVSFRATITAIDSQRTLLRTAVPNLERSKRR